MKWNQTTWNRQFEHGYGEPITIGTALAITGIVSAVGGAGLSAAIALKNAADRRQKARITQLKNKRKAIRVRRAALERRKAEVSSQIAQSKAQIDAARTKAQDRTPWVLYAGAAGLVIVSLIAARTARRA